MKLTKEQWDRREKIAEQFVRDQLTIMDGSLEAGMLRIGTERFKQIVYSVIQALPAPRS
jgi:hypothetical protein